MHPKVGPRLISGDWYDEASLPDMLAGLYREAQRPMEGIDWEWRVPGASGGGGRR